MNKTLSQAIFTGLEIEASNAERPNVYSNSWSRFFHFLILRNRGYGLRKILNLLTEVAELGCLAYIMDINLLQSFILLPITHMIVGYLQEYHTILYRATFNKKSNLVFIFGVFLVLTSVFYFLIDQSKTTNAAIFIIFGLRCVVILSQTFFTCRNIELLATKRVRPNLRFQWGSFIIASLLAVLSLQLPLNGFYNIILIGLIFNTTRFLQEFIYFKIIQSEIFKLRYVKSLYERAESTLLSAWQESALIGFHLLSIACFAVKYNYFTFFRWPILVFFIISFYDRILSRPFRSMNLEITRLLEKHYFSFSHRLTRRLLVATFGITAILTYFILKIKHWPLSHTLTTLSILSVCTVNNALLSSRKVSNWNGKKAIDAFLALQLVLIFVLLNRSLPHSVLYWICSVITLAAIYILSIENNPLEFDHKVQNNGLRKIDRRLECYEVHWNIFGNNWLTVLDKIKKMPLLVLNYNHRTKFFFTRDEKTLNHLLDQHPLNVTLVRKVQSVPNLIAPIQPENSDLVYMNFFGFWKGTKLKYKFSRLELDELHHFNRRWIGRNIYGGGSKEISLSAHTVNIADLEGNKLWFRKK